MTPNTITERETLLQEVKKVAVNGYAIDDEEWSLGLKCVAAPILDYYGKIQGTLSVSGPADRLTDKRVKNQIIPTVVDRAREISRKMGYFIGKGRE